MEAIVLARRDFKETDQVVSFYARERGYHELIGRGLKKITSKNSPQLALGMHVDVGVAPGKEFEYMTSVQVDHLFPRIRTDLTKSMALSYILSFVSSHGKAQDPDASHFFDVLCSFLYHIEGHPFRYALIDAFIWKWTAMLGFIPILDHCALGGVGELSAFSPQAGGALAQSSLKKATEEHLVFDRCSSHDLDRLQHWIAASWDEIQHDSLTESEAMSIHALVHRHAEWHLEKKIQKFDLFLKKIMHLTI